MSNAIEVPDVLGMREDDALEALAEAGVTVASTSTVEGEAARTADTVVAISPEAGELINPADPQVTLGLAGQVEVPSLLGRRVDEAREDLEDIGLVLMTDDHDDDDRILTQSPRARSAVPAGSEVEVRAL